MSNIRTRYLTKIGMLSAIAVILMFFEIPLPMMPNFLKLDASELPAIIGAFVLGPLAGVFIELIKNMLHATNTHTMGIGEMANFLVGVSFVAPAGYLYGKYSSRGSNFVTGSGYFLDDGISGSAKLFYLDSLVSGCITFSFRENGCSWDDGKSSYC